MKQPAAVEGLGEQGEQEEAGARKPVCLDWNEQGWDGGGGR